LWPRGVWGKAGVLDNDGRYKFGALPAPQSHDTALLHTTVSGTMAIIKVGNGTSDPIVTRMVAEDKVPWYKKPNLRYMYLWLFICCMGVEITSGFDSQLINTLQFSGPFNKCI
jgi:hypothetical protein